MYHSSSIFQMEMRSGKFRGTYLIQKACVRVIEARIESRFFQTLHITMRVTGYFNHTEECSGIYTLLISYVHNTCDIIRQTDATLLVEPVILPVIKG